MTFKRLYLLNGPSYQMLLETHIVNHIMVFQFIPWHLTLGGIERSTQGHLVFMKEWFCGKTKVSYERSLSWEHCQPELGTCISLKYILQ